MTVDAVAGAYQLAEEGAWLVAKERNPARVDPLRDSLGRPGLWRHVRVLGTDCEGDGAAPGQVERVFELPPTLRSAASVWDEGLGAAADPDAELLDWAAATAGGRFSGAVCPPSPAELEEWAPRTSRRIRAGSRVCHVEVIADSSRVALVAPALVRIQSSLSASREAWLEEICHDAQERWRLVRFGIDDVSESVRAEVDLTGAPSSRFRALFDLSLAALVVSASWALPGLGLVVDPGSGSRILDRMPS
jgi:hypothetical protein